MNKRNKKYVLAYVSLVIAFVLQTTLFQNLKIFGISPSLIMVLAICFSIVNTPLPSVIFSAIAGLMLDISSGRIVGLNAMMMMYMSLGISCYIKEMFMDTPRSAVMITALATFVYECIFCILSFVIFGNGSFWYMIYRVILLEVLYNGLVAFFIYFYTDKFLKIQVGQSLWD